MSRIIKAKDIKALFAKSGNLCCFPECNVEMVDKDNCVMGEIAHIEAYEKNGPRYNEKQTDEERNSFENLMLLCPTHHKLIDKKSSEYSVEYLKRMKKEHEEKFENCLVNFDFDKIFEVNKELNIYLKKIEEANNKNDSELKMKVNTDSNFEDLVLIVDKSTNYIENSLRDISSYLENLNDNILNKLKELNYDTTKWESIPYYESDFYNPFWENINIGCSNNFKILKTNLIHMEILYYTEYLKLNNDKKITDRLDELKSKLLELAEWQIYTD